MEAYTHREIHTRLMEAKKPVFISDERIDGDSLGASLAMVDFMKRDGVHVPVFVAQEIPEKYHALPCIEHCTTDEAVFDDAQIDVVVVFDCSDAAFVNGLVDRIPGEPTVINIDHHVTNTHYGHINQVIVDAPATAEVVYRFFKENGHRPSREAATCLLTGICFDTTVFSNDGTNQRAFDAASDLLRHGARVKDVIRLMFQNRSVNALRLWGTALERLTEHKALGCLTTCLTRDDIKKNRVTDEEADGLSDFLNLVTDAEMLMILRETTDGNVKVSMRSSANNVANLAQVFGGGGHTKAAGFTLPNARLASNETTGEWRVIPSKQA